MTAAQFLGKMRQPVRRVVASWTGIYQYTIDKVLEDMITRCRELKLRLAVPEEQARYEFTVLLTVQTMNYLHSGSPSGGACEEVPRRSSSVHKDAGAEGGRAARRGQSGMAHGMGRGHHPAQARPRAARHRRARRPDAHPPGHRRIQADDRLQPDGGVCRHRRLRPERRQLSGAAARALHRLQSARADVVARQGAVEEAARLSPHPVAGFHGRAAQSQAGAAESG